MEKALGRGEPGPCGWLPDRFGVSWQVIPRALGEPGRRGPREVAARQAMLQMSKIEIEEELRRAAEAS